MTLTAEHIENIREAKNGFLLKFTKEQYEEVMSLRGKESSSKVGRKFGVDHTTILRLWGTLKNKPEPVVKRFVSFRVLPKIEEPKPKKPKIKYIKPKSPPPRTYENYDLPRFIQRKHPDWKPEEVVRETRRVLKSAQSMP